MRCEKKKGGLPTNKTIQSVKQFLQERETQPQRKNTDKQLLMDLLPAPHEDSWYASVHTQVK